MNILLINHYAGSPAHGMEYRPYYFARQWVRMGHTVTIAAASRSHLRRVDPVCRGIFSTEIIDGIHYAWFRTPSYSGNGMARVLNIGAFVLQLLLHRKALSEACQGGAVIASSTYPLDVVAANAIARRARAKLVCEVHDLWPLSPVELGGISPSHPFIRVMQYAEDFAYRKVARVISVLPLAESHMRAHGLAPGKFRHVPNGIDALEWQQAPCELPEIHRSALSRLREEKRFVIGYAGAHGVSNSLDTVVSAAELLADLPVTFLLVGQGPEKAALENLAAKIGLRNIEFLPPVPKTAIPSLLRAMDALVIAWRRAPLYRFGISPNKLMDYMMAGRPVIQAMDAGNDMVAESHCGLSVAPEDPEAIAGAVTRMMNLTAAERNAMGLRGKRYVEAHHDYRDLAVLALDAVAGGAWPTEALPRSWRASPSAVADAPRAPRLS